MAEPIIFESQADFESILAGFEEIQAAAEAAGEAVASFGMASDGLTGLEDILNAIQSQTDLLDAGFSTLNDTLDGMATAADDAAASLDSIAASSAGLLEVAADAQAAGTEVEGLGTKAEATSGAMEGLQGAQGPLLMLSMGGIMAGKSFLDMGMQAQDSFSLVTGMAGVTQQSLNAMMPGLQGQAQEFGATMNEVAKGLYQVESAGYDGKDALTVEGDAMKAAKSTGTDFATVASSLTGELHAYNAPASDAGKYTDLMVEAVVRGKQSFSDFASAVGPMAATAANVGISFDQITAAESTMTQINPHVRQDANELSHLFNALALNTDAVATSAQKMGLNFNETTYKNDNLIQKLEYLRTVTKGNQTDFEKLVGGTAGLSAALALLSGNAGDYNKNLVAMQHSAGATDNALKEHDKTISAAGEHIGAALSVLSFNLMQAITPHIVPLLNDVADAFKRFGDFMTQHTALAIPILAGLATVLGGILVAAIVALVGPMLAVMAPIMGIAVAIGALVAGIVLLIQHWGQITSAIGNNSIFKAVWSILQDIGGYLKDLFVPIWHQLVDLWQHTLVPAFHQIIDALQPLMPLFEGLGMIIGGIIVVAIGVLIGVITGLVKAFSYVLSAVVQIIGGLVKIFSGAIQVISGIIHFFIDLLTGNFSNLGNDLKGIWQGIVNIFSGAWDVISGIFKAAWGAISGFVGGLVQGIIGFFTHLWDMLTGHSIIPDMIHDIISWFERLPGLIGGIFGNLASMAFSWGAHLIGNLIGGIGSMVGNLFSKVGDIAHNIASFLHFSKPDVGPLADADQWMPHFGDLLASGLQQAAAKVSRMSLSVAASISGAAPVTPALSGANAALSPTAVSTAQMEQYLLQILQVLRQQQQQGTLRNSIGPTAQNANYAAVNQYNILSPQASAQSLYQQLNILAGRAAENAARGAPAGLG